MKTGDQIIIYKTRDGLTSVDVKVDSETVWLTQAQMADLFLQTKQNISLHIKNIYKERELTRKATVKEYLLVQEEGNRHIPRNRNN
jgi:hypothetical protein